MVIIIRSNDIVSDPRVKKYIQFLESTNKPYKLIGWDRDNVLRDIEKGVFLKYEAGHNVGGFQAIKGRLVWMWFVIKTLMKLNLKDVTLHACDLDCVFPAAVFKMLICGKRNIRLIFDIFDWYTDTIPNQGLILKLAFQFMERFSVKISNYIIICEPERREQIPFKYDESKLSVLPNIPYFSESSFLTKYESPLFKNAKLTFCYVGGFIVKRCIDEIITLAEDGIINLAIAGFGNIEIEKRLRSLENHPNIRYFGKVKYQDGLRLMFNSDIIYAMYSPEIKNNIYAAPNKFYEAMFVGKALFTTKGTKVSKKTVELNMGFVAEDNLNDIKQVISSINRENMGMKGNNASRLWNDRFCNYTENYMHNIYSKMI